MRHNRPEITRRQIVIGLPLPGQASPKGPISARCTYLEATTASSKDRPDGTHRERQSFAEPLGYYEVYDPRVDDDVSQLRTSLTSRRRNVRVFEAPIVDRPRIAAADWRAVRFEFEVPIADYPSRKIHVPLRRAARGLTDAARRAIRGRRHRALPVLAHRVSVRATGLRPRGADQQLVMAPLVCVAFRLA